MNMAEALNSEIIKLYVWPGEWGLPSVDPECLTALVFFLFIFLKNLSFELLN
jgi:hypothetical protein